MQKLRKMASLIIGVFLLFLMLSFEQKELTAFGGLVCGNPELNKVCTETTGSPQCRNTTNPRVTCD